MKRKSQLLRTELIRLRKIERRIYSILMCCFLILSVFTPTFRAIAETRDVNITPQGIETTLDPNLINSSLNTLTETEREVLFDIDVEIDAEIVSDDYEPEAGQSDEPDVSETEHDDYLDPSESDDDLEFDDDPFDDQAANVDNESEITIPFDGTNFAHGIEYTQSCQDFNNATSMWNIGSNQVVLVDCPVVTPTQIVMGSNIHFHVVDGGSISIQTFLFIGGNNTFTINNGGSMTTSSITLGLGSSIYVDGGEFIKQEGMGATSLSELTMNLTAGSVSLSSLADTSSNFNLNMSGGNFTVYATNDSFFQNSSFNITSGNVNGLLNIENSTLNVANTANIAASTIKNSTMEMTGGTIGNLTIDDSHDVNIGNSTISELYVRNRAIADVRNSTITGEIVVFGESTLKIQDSTLTLSGGINISNLSDLSISASTITGNLLSMLNNSVFTLTDGSATFGQIQPINSTINVATDGNLLVQNLMQTMGGIMNMSNNGVFATSHLMVSNGTLNISDTATMNLTQLSLNYSTLNMTDGVIDVAMMVMASIGTTINMTGGTILGGIQTGVFLQGNNVHLIMSGDAKITDGQTMSPMGGGGGVTLGNNARFTMNGGIISGNTASGTGGGVLVNGSGAVFEMSAGEISNNIAHDSMGGGGVRVTNGTFTMTGGTIANNQANMGGGISHVSSSPLVISNATISENIGGGIYIAGADLAIVNTTISGNETIASQSGGGIYIINGDLVISDSIISFNVAGSNGGGITSLLGSVQIGGSQFTENTANLHGGAMYLSSNINTNIEATNFTQNQAAQDPNLPSICGTVEGMLDVEACFGDGGAIYTDNFMELTTNNVVFTENSAIRPINVDFETTTNQNIWIIGLFHNANILATTFTDGFTNAYNNFDIWDTNFAQIVVADDSSFYVVAFRENGALWGTPPTGLIVPYGEYWVVPGHHTLSRFYYDFIGWNTHPDGTGDVFTPGETRAPLNDDLVLYAQWQFRYVTVDFDLAGGDNDSDFPTQLVIIGDFATEPSAIPTKDDYLFLGWFVTATGDELFDFDTPITEATIIYAQWLRQGLSFTIPSRLEFQPQNIRNARVIAPRFDPDWEITVIDTRVGTGGIWYRPSWRLTARVDGPLRNTAGHILHGAAIIFRVAGEVDRHLSTESQDLFISHPLIPNITTNLVWGASEGFLLDVNPIMALYGEPYGATITWTLYDTP